MNDLDGNGAAVNPGYMTNSSEKMHKGSLAHIMRQMGHPATGGTLRKNAEDGAFTGSWQTWVAPETEVWNMGTYYNGEQMAVSLRAEVVYHTWWNHEGRFATALALEKDTIDPAADSEINIKGAEPPTAKDPEKRLESCEGDCEARSWVWPFAQAVGDVVKEGAKQVGKGVAEGIGEHLRRMTDEEDNPMMHGYEEKK